MKYCEEYAALLDGFADGELSPEEMERVQVHLETCPGCRAYVDDILAIRAGFPDVEDTVVPEGFAQGIMERVRADAGSKTIIKVRRDRFRRWTGTLAALAACCALVIVLRSGPVGADTGSVVSDTATVTAADTGGMEVYGMAESAEESGIETQMAPEEPMAAARAVPEDEMAESRMAVMDREDETSTGKKQAATDAENTDLPAPAAAAPPAPEEADAGILLYLSAEEAGDLLEGFDPAWETEAERGYELSGRDCESLLESLDWKDEALPETVVVVVAVRSESE